ncbi:hypothetical protein ACFP3U_30030 [Kitasatospora misakiensis]|uniref:DUF5642 domain-containing protein n=1 Tax=Kitasatospora misakiensis TaxID=67330 RepID=A0ABW0X9E5_9ACTN
MTDSDTPAGPQTPPTDAPPTDASVPDTPAAPAAEASATEVPTAEASTTEAPPAEAPNDEERAARRTRRRKAAVRWSAAAVVCALAGTGSALAVTAPERTDIPGLATKSDGRYVFPALVLPPLPSGTAVPRENKSRHAADLRRLLLPAPREAGGSLAPAGLPTSAPTGSATGSPTASASPTTSATSTTPAPGATADWADCKTLTADQKDPAKLRTLLVQYACRAATVREWTASDGTRTQIRLLAFGSSNEAWPVFLGFRDNGDPKDIDGLRNVTPSNWDMLYGVDFVVRQTPATGPGTEPAARVAYLSAGDIVGVITMTNPKGVPAAAFQQVVTLQSDLLT